MKKVFCVTAVLALLCLVGGSAFAGWTVVNLNPAGAAVSYANGVAGLSGGQQVGQAYGHAGLWTGTPGSWVDLNPAGAGWSTANDVSDLQQVGEAYGHAGLWSGTAGSWVDLNPAGAAWSTANDTSGGHQVGQAYIDGASRASLWTGAPETWVDLNPALAEASFAIGISDGRQVGFANFAGVSHASLWSDTPESWVDLHAFLPAGYSASDALSIDVFAGETWVTGYARNTSTGENNAMLWHYDGVPAPSAVPEPCSIALCALATPLLAFRRRKA